MLRKLAELKNRLLRKGGIEPMESFQESDERDEFAEEHPRPSRQDSLRSARASHREVRSGGDPGLAETVL